MILFPVLIVLICIAAGIEAAVTGKYGMALVFVLGAFAGVMLAREGRRT